MISIILGVIASMYSVQVAAQTTNPDLRSCMQEQTMCLAAHLEQPDTMTYQPIMSRPDNND